VHSFDIGAGTLGATESPGRSTTTSTPLDKVTLDASHITSATTATSGDTYAGYSVTGSSDAG